MVKRLSPTTRNSPWIVYLLSVIGSAAVISWTEPVAARQAERKSEAPRAGAPGADAKAAQPPTAADVQKKSATPAKAEAAKEAAGQDAGEDEVPDPIQTRKDIQSEVFLDPRAVAALDVAKFPEIKVSGARLLNPVELDTFKRMAGDPATPPDENLIRRVVDAQVAQLTDHRNIQALLNPTESPYSQAAKAIQTSTGLLLDAVFAARSGKNFRFIDVYNRVLLQKLEKVLVNHLIPRVQAMIILGQSGNPQALKVFLDQIKSPDQTALVKLWALKGILNLRKYGRSTLSAIDEINAARTVADLLENDRELPWPARYRALEVLGALRQGHSATRPRNLEIATVAMKILADSKTKPEVRAEAARALGMMQISQVVNDYNYEAIAYTAAEVAAELGERVSASFADNPGRSEYYASFLIGPILEAFEGTAGARDSGLLHSARPPALEKIQQLDDLIKSIAKTSIELVRATRGQVPTIQGALAKQNKALKDHLQNNVPKDRRLIPGAPDPTLADGAGERK